jgi:uncharacterized protein (DUF433 family)
VRAKRTIAIGGLAATLVGGGAALAARGGDGDGDRSEQAILNDAAKRLGVSPEDLENALAKAEDAQLDEAVKNGDLTKELADAIKQRRRRSGRVLGMPGGPPGFGPGLAFGFKGHGPFPAIGPGGVLDAVADKLGISVKELFSELRDGKTLEQIAKAHGKSLEDVNDAAKEALGKRLDEAVKDGDLTRKQADEILARLPDLIHDLGIGPGFRGPGPLGFGGPGRLGFAGPGDVLHAVADALGISVDKLFSELGDGRTLAQVAKDHGKSLDEVESAAKEALEKRLDEAVKDGDLTRRQADAILDRLPDLIDRLRVHRAGAGPRGLRPPLAGPETYGPVPRWQ